MDKAKCGKRLIARARSDSFLNQIDEEFLIEDQVRRLESRFEQVRAEIELQLDALRRELDIRLQEADERLSMSIQRIRNFRTPGQPQSEFRPDEIARVLEGESAALYQEVHQSLDRMLEKLSPRTGLVTNMIKKVRTVLEDEIGRFPNTVTLVKSSEGKSLGGQSIVDREKDFLVRSCCRPPWFLSDFRYLLERYRLARRYRVIQLPLRHTVEEHFMDHYLPEADLLQQHESVHRNCTEIFQQSWQMIRYDLEIAVADLTGEISGSNQADHQSGIEREEIVELTSGALERAHQKLRLLAPKYAEFFKDLMSMIGRQEVKDFEAIRADIGEAETLRGQSRSAWREVKKNAERTGQFLEGIGKQMKKLLSSRR